MHYAIGLINDMKEQNNFQDKCNFTSNSFYMIHTTKIAPPPIFCSSPPPPIPIYSEDPPNG